MANRIPKLVLIMLDQNELALAVIVNNSQMSAESYYNIRRLYLQETMNEIS